MNKTTLAMGSFAAGLLLGVSGLIGGSLGFIIGFIGFVLGGGLIILQFESEIS